MRKNLIIQCVQNEEWFENVAVIIYKFENLIEILFKMKKIVIIQLELCTNEEEFDNTVRTMLRMRKNLRLQWELCSKQGMIWECGGNFVKIEDKFDNAVSF